MIVFAHIVAQLHPSLLRHHWAQLDFKIPLFREAPWPVTALMALIWVVVIALRVVMFVLVLVLLVMSGLLQWGIRSKRPASALVDAGGATVLVLRPFRGDGRLVLTPNLLKVTNALVPRTALIESVIGHTIRTVGLQPIAILDQRRRLVPRGVGYHPAGGDWFQIVQALAKQAHTVIVVATPGETVRADFERELRMLADDGHEAKTVLIAPPGGDDKSRAVVASAARLLGWPQQANLPLVCFHDADGMKQYGSFHGDVFQTEVCRQAITDAIARTQPTVPRSQT